jgi:hypothetical protein
METAKSKTKRGELQQAMGLNQAPSGFQNQKKHQQTHIGILLAKTGTEATKPGILAKCDSLLRVNSEKFTRIRISFWFQHVSTTFPPLSS